MMAPVKAMADRISRWSSARCCGQSELRLQENASQQIVAALDMWRDMNETFAERMFLLVYGSPLLQTAVGIDPADTGPQRKAGKSPLHRELLQTRIDETQVSHCYGGLRECLIRGMLFVGMAPWRRDERGLAAIRRLRTVLDNEVRLTLADFKDADARAIFHVAHRSRCHPLTPFPICCLRIRRSAVKDSRRFARC